MMKTTMDWRSSLHESQTKVAEQSAALLVQQAHLLQQETAMLEMQKMMATMSAQMAMIAKPAPVVPLSSSICDSGSDASYVYAHSVDFSRVWRSSRSSCYSYFEFDDSVHGATADVGLLQAV